MAKDVAVASIFDCGTSPRIAGSPGVVSVRVWQPDVTCGRVPERQTLVAIVKLCGLEAHEHYRNGAGIAVDVARSGIV